MTRQLTWGDLGQQFDGPHATPTRRKDGPYFLNISSLDNGRLDLSKSDHVSPEEFTKWTRRVTPREGDLLFSYETRLGAAALMPAGLAACLGRRMALLRPDLAVVDPRFLLYYYLSPSFQRLIEKHSIHGATVPRILLSDMPQWPVSVPALPEQRAIAEVLGALDDKIAANRRVLSCALELASAMWRKCASTASESKPLRDVATLHYGKALPAGSREPGPVDVYGSGGVVGSHTQALVSGPGVVVGRKGTAGAVHWADGPHYPIDTTYWVEGKGSVGAHYLFFALRQAGLTEMNSDSAVPGLNRDEAYARPIPVPQSVDHDIFVRQCSALFDLVAQMKRESAALAASRDSLLPLLMSGKVRVKDAEKVVEGVV